MKILVVSNLYPPHHVGGYELGCQQIADALADRGHQVSVLTSTYGVDQPVVEGNVHRKLRLCEDWKRDDNFNRVRAREAHNQREYLAMLDAVQPDILYFFNMRLLPKSLIFLTAGRKLPYSLYISDDWLATWQDDYWYQNWKSRNAISRRHEPVRYLRTLLLDKTGKLPFDRPISWKTSQFTSNAIKQQTIESGLDTQDCPVIHWGVSTAVYHPGAEASGASLPRRLLFVGRLVPTKGFHIVLDAFLSLARDKSYSDITLTVVGGYFNDSTYEQEIKEKIAHSGLADRIRFTGNVPRHEVAQIYREHDILIFASIWDEPFSIALLEAMASGLAIVSTDTGGSREILTDNQNALIYAKESADQCADRLVEILTDREKHQRLSEAARATIKLGYEFSHMADTIEAELKRVLAQSPPAFATGG